MGQYALAGKEYSAAAWLSPDEPLCEKFLKVISITPPVPIQPAKGALDIP